jgi:hypothetical protein
MRKNRTGAVKKLVYPVLLATALFTGFGNMPLYKRYYISAVPGLGWSSDFYVNLYIHYVCGALLLALAVYCGIVYLKKRGAAGPLTATGTLRTLALGLSLMTGILLAVRNLSGITFTFAAQITVAFTHLTTAIVLLLATVGCRVLKRPWTRPF